MGDLDDPLNILAAQLARESARLRAANRRLFDLLDNVGDMAYIKDLDGVYQYINDAGAALLGLTPREVVGQRDRDLFEPEAVREVTAQDREVVATGELVVVRVERVFPDGAHELVTRKWPWRDDEGRIVGVVGVTREVTEERAVRREAAALAEGLSHLIDTLPDVVLVHSDGVIRHANPAATSLFGGGRDLVGSGLAESIGADDARRVEGLREPGAGGIELVVARADEPAAILDVRDVPASWFGTPVRLLFGRDVSDRRRTEAQLASTESMATLGLLASSIAHEIRNPLTFVIERLRALEERAPAADRAGLADVLDAAGRIQSIVRDVAGFGRPDDDEAPVANVDGVIDRALVLARARVMGTEFHRERGAHRPARVGERRLCQVVLNLVINASQAAGAGTSSAVWITTWERGRQIYVRVRDSGPGVPSHLAQRIFDPFVTTKSPGEGTGLGLWLSHGLVQSAGGDLKLENPGERGASFLVSLPISSAAMPRRVDSLPPTEDSAAKRKPVPAPTPSARPRLLVVDDEPLITDLVSMGLGDAFEVVCANGVLAAQSRLAEAPRFDLVLCDLMMPGGGGARVHAAVQELGGGAPPMVFMSGGTADGGARRFLADNAVTMVEKPFRLADLRRRLLAALRR